MAEILVIDDERGIRNTLTEILEYEKFIVTTCEDGDAGIKEALGKDYDVILCDIKMPKKDGIEVLELLQLKKPDIPFILITGHGTVETAVEALKKGAYDFIEKPLDLNRLLVSIRNALDRNSLVEETKTLKKKINGKKNTTIIGESQPIQEVIDMIEKVAPTDARVLITGPNGTGKELVARQLHQQSERNKSSFVEVNCAAIPPELIESELFGHEKGAFTSAIKQRKGKFEQASGGTLFLDEIGDMSLSAQAKVLRALQEHKITRVGGDKDIKVDTRVIAATNKDLQKEIAEGNFREDLYHRLCVIHIKVPALSERAEDIALLAPHFAQIICKEQGINTKEINKDAIKALQQLPWTGNIRELRNVIERLIILGNNPITKQDIEQYA
jgi:DNA-binding NtrC family response regulator